MPEDASPPRPTATDAVAAQATHWGEFLGRLLLTASLAGAAALPERGPHAPPMDAQPAEFFAGG
jgi:hypothetical protein